ncbi:MAG: hypothetical protein U9R05_00070 [Chloroflexota bacterium]|nr:hypothetical protein [Chloroflexota bacterium]
MPEYTLTVLDTPGIQEYIFGSNRLRENIGASELVRRATETWPLELLRAGWRSNVAHPDAAEPAQRLDTTLRIEDGELDVEVVYIGGGNTVLLFRDKADAKELVTRLSRRLIEYAPGLRLVAAHVPVDWDKGDLGARVDAAMVALSEQKDAYPHGQPQLGLGVTVECRSTGLVATTTNAEHGKPEQEANFPISDAVAGKLETVRAANDRLSAFRPAAVRRAGLEFPLDFDDFGRSEGEMSYLAVVHADGNEMGRFFRKIGKQATDSRDYVRRMRKASIQVEEAASAALQQLILELVGAVEYDTEKKVDTLRKVFALYQDKDKRSYLPFRPLVFGGDDVTFVCDGRLGLTLTARYLELFEAESQRRDLNLYACAGIAVVKTHYPFARAYGLAEELTQRAKKYTRVEEDGNLSALDWHFAAGGLLGSIEEIRAREYEVKEGDLTLRPLPLHRAGWRGWTAFAQVVTAFNQEGGDWYGHRNKVMALREILREGAEATQNFLHGLGRDVELPKLDTENSAWQETGWVGKQCGYFDAIEALEFYVPLKEVEDADV